VTSQAVVDVLGWLAFKIPVQVTPGCLGKTVRFQIAGRAARLVLPRLEWQGDRPHVVPPSMPPDVLRHLTHWTTDSDGWELEWGQISSWSPTRREAREAYIAVALLSIKAKAEELTYGGSVRGRGAPEGPLVDEVFESLDPWLHRLRNWIEVLVDQDLDPDHPLRSVSVMAEGLTLLTVDGDVISSPRTANHLTIVRREEEPVTLPMLRRAAALASSGHDPVTAHLLLRDGRAALRRGHLRRSIIEIGTALEIALADLNRTRTQSQIGNRPTLGTYVKDPAIAAAARLPSSIMQDVVTPRNDAIHNNNIPTPKTVAAAAAIVRKVLLHIEPLPT
jgi:hypothetical protein